MALAKLRTTVPMPFLAKADAAPLQPEGRFEPMYQQDLMGCHFMARGGGKVNVMGMRTADLEWMPWSVFWASMLQEALRQSLAEGKWAGRPAHSGGTLGEKIREGWVWRWMNPCFYLGIERAKQERRSKVWLGHCSSGPRLQSLVVLCSGLVGCGRPN